MSPIFCLRGGVEFILASASPRRAALLGSLGFPFSIKPAENVEPGPKPGECGRDFALRSALAKGRACIMGRGRAPGPAVILAADTIVCLDKEIMGKPRGKAEARAMLLKLNGKCHEVITGIYLAIPENDSSYHEISDYEMTSVCLGNWPASVLAAYVESGEPADKAGAYAIQGIGAFLARQINGSWTNVVGLPLEKIILALLRHSILKPAF